MAKYSHERHRFPVGGQRPNRYYPMPQPETESDVDRGLNSSAADPDFPGLRVVPVFSGEKFREVCPYPVIVESWEKRLHGSGRRRYRAEFTEKERATIARWQTKFEGWYLRTGTPKRVIIEPSTLRLLRRAVDFFASI